jgi:hypothetical protein
LNALEKCRTAALGGHVEQCDACEEIRVSYNSAGIDTVRNVKVLNATVGLHPHIHYIVPAGGIDREGNWRNTRSEGDYLFPVKAMSAAFSLFTSILISKSNAVPFAEKAKCILL